MKTNSITLKTATICLVAILMAFFTSRPVFSQENVKNESSKKIILKIVSDDNGKTTVVDTTIENPDSNMLDSINRQIERVIVTGKGGRHGHFKFRNMPEGFNYKFEIPDFPEPPVNIEEIETDGNGAGGNMEDCMSGNFLPGMHQRICCGGNNSQTLNDLLGEIPLDRVVGYTIKDHKNGKRIIIDLKEAPMFERQSRVIVIHEPGSNRHAWNGPKKHVKVYIKKDKIDSTQGDNDKEVITTPAPPPAPSAKPDQETPKKPKI